MESVLAQKGQTAFDADAETLETLWAQSKSNTP